MRWVIDNIPITRSSRRLHHGGPRIFKVTHHCQKTSWRRVFLRIFPPLHTRTQNVGQFSIAARVLATVSTTFGDVLRACLYGMKRARQYPQAHQRAKSQGWMAHRSFTN